MLRRSAAQLRAVWPFDSWDIIGGLALLGIAVGMFGLFGFYVALLTICVPLAVLAFVVALAKSRTPPGA